VRRLILLIGLVATAAWPSSASAIDFPVACTAGNGDEGELVTTISDANVEPGPDRLVLGQNCLYRFAAPDNYWYGPNALPPIASDITIEGNGSTIARGGITINNPPPPFRLFFVGANPVGGNRDYATPGPGRLTLRDVTLAGGLAKGGDAAGGGGGAGMGGAIFSQGFLKIERSTLSGNAARGGNSAGQGTEPGGGGGIGHDAAGGDGGAMAPPGPLVIFGGGLGSFHEGGTAGGGGGFATGTNGGDDTAPGDGG
jgi:hypothetical protein